MYNSIATPEVQSLPQNQENEKTVLASLIYDNSLIPQAASLTAEDFYSTDNQRLFQAIVDMHRQGLAVDISSLATRGIDSGYLAELADHESTTNIKYYADFIRELSIRRKAINTLTVSMKKLYDPDVEFKDAVDGLEDAIKPDVDSTEPWSSEELTAIMGQMLTTEPEPFQFIVPGLLSKGVTGFLYGEGGSAKSMAALWLCVQLATKYVCNSKWLGRFPLDGEPVKTMFCSIEDMILDVHHRIRPIINALCLMRPDVSRDSIESAVKKNVFILPREIWMQDKQQYIVDSEGSSTFKADKIAKFARENNVGLIIIDTLSRACDAEENENRLSARYVSATENIRDACGASIVTVAHISKASRGGQNDVHGQNALRGGGALMDNSRFGLWFKACSSKNESSIIEIVHSKPFRSKRCEKFKVQFDYPEFKLYKDEKTAEDDLTSAVVDDVRQYPGTTQRKTCKRLGKGRTPVSFAFKDATDEGLIILKSKKEGYFVAE